MFGALAQYSEVSMLDPRAYQFQNKSIRPIKYVGVYNDN